MVPRPEEPARFRAEGEVVGGRYRILDFLGRGGAGTVWRAQDLLAGPVAIKRLHKTVEDLVKLPPGESTPSSAARHELALSLAHEFQTLASVRHPHVISVLDYGFDAEGRPYLAMDLLEDARHLVQAGANQPLSTQVDLLVQTLHALAYLHRRGVIHRDLKPANVLVTRGQVKVLDFGLAVGRDRVHHAQPGGTPGYLAPELFEDQPPSEVTDLFSVGAMACQMMFGRLPFDGKVQAPAGFPAPLRTVLERLVSKDPRERPRSADAAISALCTATGRPVPVETVTTRESFLQAARYVGRARELSRLGSVLEAALAGRGGGMLVGGESGVGKSRLLDELRPMALVRGAVVLRGQAVAAGGSPYQEWRPVLRWLSVLVPLDEREASVLKPLVPDLEVLLGRPVADPAELGAEMAHARLLQLVEDLFERLAQPTVVVLEDLHWAHGESLLLLSRLAARAARLPLLLLGSFRDDEAPTLPVELPGLDVLRLPRLDAGEIAVLSESMIGPAGARPHLVELLRRETEGNPFFLVEVARALAEEAGGLDRLGEKALPERVFAGGVRRLVRRRLEKVPVGSRDLLRVAAILGRQVNAPLLRAAAPGVDVERWLSDCAAAAVLDVADGHWRFAHDKLREGVLEELAAAERPLLHRRVAEALEAAYRDVPDEWTAALCYHWGEAGDSRREAEYAQRAGEAALRVGACREALPFLTRALERVSSREVLRMGHLEALLAEARFQLGELETFRRHAERALNHFGWPVPTSRMGWALGTVSQVVLRLAQSARPDAYDEETEERRRVRRVAGRLLMRLIDAFIYAQEALPVLWAGLRTLNLCEPAGASPELARGYTNMAVVAGTVPIRPVAEVWMGRAREVAERVGSPADLAYVLNRNAVYATYVARWAEVEAWLERAIGIVDSVGDFRLAEECRALLTVASCYQGKFHRGLPLMEWLENSARRRGALQTQHWALHYQAFIHLRLGNLVKSRIALDQTVAWTEAQGGLTDRIIVEGTQALLRLREGDVAGARVAAEKALEKLSAGKAVAHFVYFGVTTVAEVLLTLWEREGGRDAALVESTRAAVRAVEGFARVFPFGEPAARLWRGYEAWLSGDAQGAYDAWRECIAVGTAKETAYEEARARYELARHLPEDDPGRSTHMARAVERFAQLGTQDDLTLARVLQPPGA
ncbi:AAA family ATPase [Myxococcus sp. K15C18031901]|uniref:serine/threonine-protein kinase n=1 Tax=Myxococcus dinghuensis TaxID=2906761 RepID=UPI0020A7245C|nr:serine/threonine-protein kinase [Myxococcus dinghuensis]MCP3105019.1 AAA family ATPase [Myxococcus dinghuensis]